MLKTNKYNVTIGNSYYLKNINSDIWNQASNVTEPIWYK